MNIGYIIGISGHAGVGKDTVASMINYIFKAGITKATYREYATYAKQYLEDDVRIIHFAGNLKDALSIIYQIDRAKFDDRAYKDNYWYCLEEHRFYTNTELVRIGKNKFIAINIWNLRERSIADIVGLHPEYRHLIKLRTILQYFGTDVCRKVLGDSIWIDGTMKKAMNIAIANRLCLIPDVRFANEAKAIKSVKDSRDASLYGVLIAIDGRNVRNIDKSYVPSQHISETDKFDSDFTITNDSTKFDLFYKTFQVVQDIMSKELIK